jgi:hypothetical protein
VQGDLEQSQKLCSRWIWFHWKDWVQSFLVSMVKTGRSREKSWLEGWFLFQIRKRERNYKKGKDICLLFLEKKMCVWNETLKSALHEVILVNETRKKNVFELLWIARKGFLKVI